MIGFRKRPYLRRGMMLSSMGSQGRFIKLTRRQGRAGRAVDILAYPPDALPWLRSRAHPP